MMKQGKIVDEGTCDELINKHGRENLEETFLKIARSHKWTGIKYMLWASDIYIWLKDLFQEFLI